jgi:hypothetical protein
MEWMLFAAFYPPPLEWQDPGGSQMFPETVPTETDLWVTARTYEFAAVRSTCGKCGAELGGKLSVAVVPGTTWLIAVNARCRGWRRHRHTALVSEWHGGLRFGELRPS